MASYSFSRRPTLWKILSTAFILVQVVLAQECNYVGGWSLRFPSSSCPQDAPYDCGKAGDLQMRCCPAGLSCAGNGSYEGNYCYAGIKDSADFEEFRDLAYEYPKCPNPTWSLWAANDTVDNKPKTGAWCCEPGSKGIYRDNHTSANYFCTGTTVTTLQTNFYWAQTLSTTSCSPTATPPVGSTPAESVSSATASATSFSGSSDGESASISTGAIAGAAVGGVAVVAFIAVGVLFYLRRRKRSKHVVTEAVDTREEHDQGTKWYASKARRVSELETVEPRLEMDGTKPTYELDANVENIPEEGVSPLSPRPR